MVDASNMTQNVDSKADAEEQWQRLKLIPNSIHLINEMTGVVDIDAASQSSEEIKLEEKLYEPLASKIHVNPEGDTKKDFHPAIDPGVTWSTICRETGRQTVKAQHLSYFQISKI